MTPRLSHGDVVDGERDVVEQPFRRARSVRRRNGFAAWPGKGIARAPVVDAEHATGASGGTAMGGFRRLHRPGVDLYAVSHLNGSDLVPLTVAEIRRLLDALLPYPRADRDPVTHALKWSAWRRRRQAVARRCHYRKRSSGHDPLLEY
jgi:hypothetical protein